MALIPEEHVELPRDRTLIIHVEAEIPSPPGEAPLQPVLIPSEPDAARRLIHDLEAGRENF